MLTWRVARIAMPLGWRSTALDVVRGKDLSGRTAVITGGNSGASHTSRLVSASKENRFDPITLETASLLYKPAASLGWALDLADLSNSVMAFRSLRRLSSSVYAGIGVETARAFLAAGARVVFSSRDQDAGQKVARELKTAAANQASPR